MPNFFDKENFVLYYENLQICLGAKKIHRVLEFNQSYCQIWQTHTKKVKLEKNGEKDGKVSYKLMNNAKYDKTMENL